MFSLLLSFHNTGVKIHSDNHEIFSVISNNLKPYLTSKNSHPKITEISITRAKKVIDIPRGFKKLAYYHNVQLFQSQDKTDYFVTDGFNTAEINPVKGLAEIHYYPVVEKDTSLFTPLFFTIVLIELLRYRGIYYLHSGGVSKDRKNCILIAGEGNTGKTTLTTTFIKYGYYFLGDDALFFYENKGEIYVHSFARDFQFTRDGIKYFPELLRYISNDNGTIKLSLPCTKIFHNKLIQESKPFIILFTKIADKKKTSLNKLPSKDALKNLILCSQQVMFDNINAKPHLEALNKLVVQCKSFSVLLGKDLLEYPGNTIQKLEETICQYQK